MELLSPAGSWEALVAAVQNGADAVYLGFGGFNARRTAGNFDGDEFERAVEYCHARGVRVHVTLNTLVKQRELDGFAQAALDAARAGADAAIVQDLGGAQLLRALCPGLKLHMSTQAACCNAQGVRFAAAQGYDRVVLARECLLDEIARCAQVGVEIETFVHGALCVCFSGQCLFSSLVGGRSGNRGLCAQPCRLGYALCDAATGRERARGCLLSPRDIMLVEELPALERAGVRSLKIEGRLKRPEYVAEVMRVYRRALDMLAEHPEKFAPDAADERALRQIFNRGGFSQAYLDGHFRDCDITDITRPNNMGVRVGEVKSVGGGRLRLRLDMPLDAGDQLSLRSAADETGFELKQALPAGNAELPMPSGLKLAGGLIGAQVYRAASQVQLERARRSCEGEHVLTRVEVRARLRVGERAQLTLSAAPDAPADIRGISVHCVGDAVSPARRASLEPTAVEERLARFGGTPLEAADMQVELDAQAFMPVAALNALRRDATQRFIEAVLERRRGCPAPPEVRGLPALPAVVARDAAARRARPLLVVQSRALADAELGDALYWAPAHVDRASLEREFAARGPGMIYLRLPNMLGSAELTEIAAFACDHGAELKGCVLTNVSQLGLELPGELVADMNMNAWNSRTVELLRTQGVRRVTGSLELTCAELSEMDLRGLERELIVYGRAELMTLRHCPLNARGGLAHVDCRLCDAGKGLESCELVDRKQAHFPLRRYRGASGCYAQVLNSAPHDLLSRLARLPEFDAARLVFTVEAASERRQLAQRARTALEAWARGEASAMPSPSGATAGHYFRGVD